MLLLRTSSTEDLVRNLRRKLQLVSQLLSNKPSQEEIGDIERCIICFYCGLSMEEMRNVRYTVVNSFRTMQVAVGEFVDRGVQNASGQTLPCRHGPSSGTIGTLMFFPGDGRPVVETRFPVAGAKDSRRHLMGENWYV